MKNELYTLLTASEARSCLQEYASKHLFLETEEVALFDACGRVLAVDIFTTMNIPEAPRSTMDGFALRAKDTNGASEGMPAYLTLAGEIEMGQVSSVPLEVGYCIRIWTGGFLPDNADAVVMLEYTEAVNDTIIEISRAVAVAENTIAPGEDIKKGELLFSQGHRLLPQDIGVLAALGISTVVVKKRMKIGIVASGDELVSPDQPCPLGKIRDINSYTLGSQLKEHGYLPVLYGIAPDCEAKLQEKISEALQECDMVLLSGGSSVGARDLTIKILEGYSDGSIYFHGISVRPGKPSIFASVNRKPVFGLPGPPVSAYVIFTFFVLPFLNCMQNVINPRTQNIADCIAGENINSAPGREDYLRVRIDRSGEKVYFFPTNQKSGLVKSLVDSDGYAVVPEGSEGICQGEKWEVILHE